MSNDQPLFWSDQLAFGITMKFQDQDEYVVASGISPSGIVHAGNFREIITSDFVAKSLKNRGEDVRFVYSWDDYDRFRERSRQTFLMNGNSISDCLFPKFRIQKDVTTVMQITLNQN